MFLASLRVPGSDVSKAYLSLRSQHFTPEKPTLLTFLLPKALEECMQCICSIHLYRQEFLQS